jgi:hypothetical protein
VRTFFTPQPCGVSVLPQESNCTLIEMPDPIDLPPELQQVADQLAEQPPAVREMFRYAIVLAMIDDEKAWVTGTRLIDSREYLAVRTVAGDVFEIVRPPISEELEAALMSEVGSIVADEDER